MLKSSLLPTLLLVKLKLPMAYAMQEIVAAVLVTSVNFINSILNRRDSPRARTIFLVA